MSILEQERVVEMIIESFHQALEEGNIEKCKSLISDAQEFDLRVGRALNEKLRCQTDQ